MLWFFKNVLPGFADRSVGASLSPGYPFCVHQHIPLCNHWTLLQRRGQERALHVRLSLSVLFFYYCWLLDLWCLAFMSVLIRVASCMTFSVLNSRHPIASILYYFVRRPSGVLWIFSQWCRRSWIPLTLAWLPLIPGWVLTVSHLLFAFSLYLSYCII